MRLSSKIKYLSLLRTFVLTNELPKCNSFLVARTLDKQIKELLTKL